jgi:hydrogenase/urease accessory protein HupE
VRARWVLLLVTLLTVLAGSTAARAHGTRSVSIDVTELGPGKAVVHVRPSNPADRGARAVLSAPCVATPAEEGADDDDHAVTAVTCPGGLAGSRITVEGLGPILSEAILVVELHDGKRLSRVLTADEPSFVLPAQQSGLAVAGGYVRLGVAHILTGYDHLLFLLSLVLLLRRPRAVLLAETAFTVSHSLSFSATALGLVHVSAPAAEAAIALSLVLVALDIGRTDEGLAPSARKGAALAFVFGLVHGLGFAGGLSEIGLPDHDVSLALVGFATGVEVGQVAFLAVALLVLHLGSRHLPRWGTALTPRWLRPALPETPLSALLIGGIASYWLIERTLVCLSSRV